MFSSAELIEVLRRRARRSLRPESPSGQLPPGWQAWLEAIRPRPGAIHGATSADIVRMLLLREPAPPPRRVADLGRWRAFATLWRQQWHPAWPEERWTRRIGLAGSLVANLFFMALLLWLMYLRFLALPSPGEGVQDVVRVEFIGTGTPEERGGGKPEAPLATKVEPAASPAARPRPQARPRSMPKVELAQPQLQAQAPAVAVREVPEPPSPPEQPVQVSEPVPSPSEFSLTPPTPHRTELQQPVVAVPQLQAPTPEVRMVEIPAPPQPVSRELPTPELAAPQLTSKLPEVTQREVPAPLQAPRLPALAQPAAAAHELEAAIPAVSVRDVPAPAGPASEATSAAASAATAAAASDARSGNATPSAGERAPGNGLQGKTAAAGSGPEASDRPGASPTPLRGDDWGISNRNRPGGTPGGSTAGPGLFNDDGSPRLAQSPPGGSNLPADAFVEHIDNLDKAGTWLKRPPYDYTPTRFDKYWIPGGTLLEEWVRRGIRKLSIPIPGTGKRLACIVSILQAGGGCALEDPNLNDQEAEARPPPDIPFKPELQEDQSILAHPADKPSSPP